jgi:hypothetical protein
MEINKTFIIIIVLIIMLIVQYFYCGYKHNILLEEEAARIKMELEDL